MHRGSLRSLSLFAVAGSVAAIGLFTASPARSQLGVAKNYVQIQATTPGTAQSGHANVSGTMRAAQFAGGGGGLTGLNASNLTSGILPVARIPNPLVLSGSDPTGVVNLSGTATGTVGATLQSSSSVPAGELGFAGYFKSNATVSFALAAENLNTSGTGGGFIGVASSPGGYGVAGQNISPTGGIGGLFQVEGDGSVGLEVKAPNPSGNNLGLFVSVQSPDGIGISSATFANSGLATAGIFTTFAPDGDGIRGINSATTGIGHGVYGVASSANAAGVRGENLGGGLGGRFSSSVVALQSTSTGTSGIAGQFVASGTEGVAVSGAGTGAGGFFSASTSSGFGLLVRNDAPTGPATGGSFLTISANGRGIIGQATWTGEGDAVGVTGLSDTAGGIGVFASATATSGTSVGLVAQSASPSGVGILARNSATLGFADAIRSLATAPEAAGAYIQNLATSGPGYGVLAATNSPSGIAIYGLVPSSTSVNYAVLGASDSPSGWGLFANGRSGASGTKSFRIDHPQDPENKYLLHYSSEGPEPLNLYQGRVTTDTKGFAIVRLPNYFADINRDPQYQLTVIDDGDDFVMAKVVREIENNQFVIRTSKPNVKVSWEVKAIRNDLWMQRNGAPAEVEKTPRERGRYQHPELYGAPAQRGTFYSGRPTSTVATSKRK